MQRRTLGSTQLSVGRISLGCVTFGREIDQEASFRIMDYAVERGINLFDTAEAYGPAEARQARAKMGQLDGEDDRGASAETHASERIIGRWLKSRNCRDKIILQSKLSPPLTPERIRRALGASLERLQTDHLDIYVFHAADPRTPLEESLAAMEEQRAAGRIRFIGASNFTAEHVRAAVAAHTARLGLQTLQLNYNLAVRDIERELLPLARRHDIGVQTYSPLGAGFLTGKYAPGMQKFPEGSRFDLKPGHARVYFSQKSFRIVERLREMSGRTGVPMPRLAMGWVLANPRIDTVLVGARTTAHLDNALEAMETELPPLWIAEMSGVGG